MYFFVLLFKQQPEVKYQAKGHGAIHTFVSKLKIANL